MFAIADAVLKSDAMSMRSKGIHKIPFLALFVLSACLPFVACGTPPENVAPSLVPWPQKIQAGAANIGLGAQSKIVARTEELRPLADVLAGEISLVTGLQLAVKVGAASPGDIFLSLEPSLKGEAHTYIVTDRSTVQGGNYAAVALGTTTLLQSLQIRSGKVSLPMMSVEDAPQTEYRGLFVDVARQYHSLSNLRQMAQLCRLYKIRYLHLHFTDDQSFMFPSKAYPKLATQNQHGGKTYTIEELKDLVAFADARGVTIIPELDVPGHSAAMNRAMRDLFMIKGTKPYEHHASINFAKAEVMQALETIVGEMCEVFKSSPYFHIGGDEADLAFANQNEDFKAAFAKYNLPNQHQLYRKFVADMNDIVKKHGKQTMVWEGFGREADSPIQIPKDVIVMAYEMRFYQPDKLVKDGYRVINTSWTPLYVVNGGRSTEEIFAWQARQFKPFGAKAEDKGVILPPEAPLFGAQMCAWEQSESVELPSLRRRLATMSERVWNQNATRSYEEFSRHLESTDRVLDALVHQLTVRTEGTRIAGEQKFSSEVTLTVALAPGAKGTARYTLDGKDPTPTSAACDAPIRIASTTNFKARLFDAEGKPLGYPFAARYEIQPITAEAAGLLPKGTFRESITLTLHSSAKGEIRYTLDGKEPAADTPLYTTPLRIEQSAKVKAALFIEGKRIGDVWVAQYTKLNSEKNLTTGKPVTASSIEGGCKPENIVDGNVDTDHAWWAGPYPQWVQIDLQKTSTLNRIHVFPYWDGSRSYQYTVEISNDAKAWTQVADMSQNTKPSTPEGTAHTFAPAPARYIRVNMLKNSANKSVHLVEVRAYEVK